MNFGTAKCRNDATTTETKQEGRGGAFVSLGFWFVRRSRGESEGGAGRTNAALFVNPALHLVPGAGGQRPAAS